MNNINKLKEEYLEKKQLASVLFDGDSKVAKELREIITLEQTQKLINDIAIMEDYGIHLITGNKAN